MRRRERALISVIVLALIVLVHAGEDSRKVAGAIAVTALGALVAQMRQK